MKVTIELDTGTPGDFEALQRMFAANATSPTKQADKVEADPPMALVKAALRDPDGFVAPPAPDDLHPAAAPLKPAKAPPKAAKKLAERGKEMTKAAKALSKAAGAPKPPLTRSEIGKLGSAARWAGKRQPPPPPVKEPKKADKAPPAPKAPKKADKPPPPPPKPPKVRPEPKPKDYSKAEEQSLDAFPEVAGEIVAPMGEPAAAFPDGRELLEGTFQMPAQPAEPKEEEGEDHEREIERIARENGGLPAEPE